MTWSILSLGAYTLVDLPRFFSPHLRQVFII